MSDPRWTDETEALVYEAVSLGPEDLALARHRSELTAAILAALADAGLLVPPGGETRRQALRRELRDRGIDLDGDSLPVVVRALHVLDVRGGPTESQSREIAVERDAARRERDEARRELAAAISALSDIEGWVFPDCDSRPEIFLAELVAAVRDLAKARDGAHTEDAQCRHSNTVDITTWADTIRLRGKARVHACIDCRQHVEQPAGTTPTGGGEQERAT